MDATNIDTSKTNREKAWWELHKNVDAVKNKYWKQHTTKLYMYGHLLLIK